MKLSEVSIQRPVFATVLSLAILLLGIIGLSRLPVREYPDIDPPIVSITTFYRGASPSVVETEITNILEEQLATLAGVKTLTSSSVEQGSVITVEFELERPVDEAANEVRDKVSRVRGQLPREADDPIVSKVDANAQPIIWLALTSKTHSLLELSDVADRVLKERLQRLPGVGAVFIGAERRYAMRVWLDPLKLTSHRLTPHDVEAAIGTENVEVPGGRVEGTEREFAVRTRGELNTPEEFANIIVQRTPDGEVRLGDVAEVTLGAEDERTAARYNGQPAIGLGIVKQSKASTLDVGRDVRKALPELAGILPPGMSMDVAYDSSTFIQDSVDEVKQTILIAIVLVVLVVLMFLKSPRATLIPVVAIPISIVGAFVFAFFLGYTINILTLLALVLAIGIVVDDAIVMLENIVRHLEMGKSRLQAAQDGAKEIGFAVLATTIALIAVFIPVSFLTGTVGRLFREFGIMVAVSVAISGFVALTLSPMLCSKILRPIHGGKSRAGRAFDAFFNGVDNTYERVLNGSLRHRALTLGIALALLIGSVFLFRIMPRELVPVEDRGIAFGIVIAPEGSTLQYTDSYVRQIEQILLPLPERRALFTATGLGFNGPGRVTNAFVFLNLKPRGERKKSQQQIVQELFPKLLGIPGVLAFVINPPSLGGRFSSSPVEYVLEADSYDELAQATGIMMQKASQLGYLINLDSDLRLNKPELDISIDRDRASALGVSVSDIGTTLETLLGGRVVSQFKRGTKQYDVIAQVKPSGRATPDIISQLYVRGTGGLVQLANLLKVEETVAPKELNHHNRVRAATISANLAPGVDLATALDDLDRISKQDLPAGVKRELAGQSLEFRSSSSKLYFLFLFAVVFIYLVLAAQFESFIHPITILLTVPLAVVGAVISLFVLKQSLNIFSQIGLIMLVGLVTKNAILIVEYSNQLRKRGRSLHNAVVEASRIRLRPILMTSFATIFGILPIAIGIGEGAESRRPLGIAVVGGLLFSTFLTLVVVPVVYTLLGKYAHVETEEVPEEELEEEEIPARIHAIPD